MSDERLRKIEEAQASLKAETRGQSKLLGRILIEVKGSRKDFGAHEKLDEKRLSKVETEIGWIKRIGAVALGLICTALGIKG